MVEKDNAFEWGQFCKLGEMMGDGLHYEPDGKWIAKEYNRLARILMHDYYKEQRKVKSDFVDEKMNQLLNDKKCTCGGILKQSRSGSKVVYCQDCNARYTAKYKKKS